MEVFLFGAALLAFGAGGPAGALLMRCGLSASLRFSPRAAVALASLCALCAAAARLPLRGGLRAVHGPPARLAAAGFAGGVAGRSLLLMACARWPSSLSLSRMHALPLLLVTALWLLPKRRSAQAVHAPLLLTLLCAAVGGFLGAGDAVLLSLVLPDAISRRRALSSDALLVRMAAQGGALLLTLLSGAAQVFPMRMLFAIALGAIAGAILSEQSKERGAFQQGMRAALRVYGVLAALSCAEQAL